jgi:serine protease inhibitor
VLLVAAGLALAGSVERAAAGPATTAHANNQFAFDLYKDLRNKRGNLFFSPLAISTALAMVHAGARGLTAEEIASTLHLGDDDTLAAYAELLDDLTSKSDSTTDQLGIANRLWGRSGAQVLDSFRAVARDRYGADIETLDFTDAAGARARINAWVKETTSGKIDEIIASGTIGPLTRLVLTNTINFEGAWTKAFDPDATVETAFKRNTSTEVPVHTMRRTSEFAWARVEGLSLIELPYEGERLSMVVLLPDSTDGLPELEARLSLVQLDKWLSSLRPTLVQVLLPRFRMQAGYDLIPSLNSLGMRSAFVARVADFSGIDDGPEPLWIDYIAHKAYVDVNERGTEAAAATELVLRTLGYAAEEKRPQVFWVDHPFVFLVRDRLTGAIVFLGRVVDPSPA